MDFTVRQWNWALALIFPFRGVPFLCFGAGDTCIAGGVMMSLSPLSMVFSALQALLHPVDAYQQPPSNGRMQCIPTD